MCYKTGQFYLLLTCDNREPLFIYRNPLIGDAPHTGLPVIRGK